MTSKILIIFFLFLLSSCSLFEVKEVVSIDSEPRDSKVYIIDGEKRKLLGKTPLLKKISPKDQEKLYFKFEDYTGVDDLIFHASSVEKKCRDHEKEKNGKDCRLLVFEKLPEVVPLNPEKICKTFMVIPPKSNYRVVSRKIREYWVDNIFNK